MLRIQFDTYLSNKKIDSFSASPHFLKFIENYDTSILEGVGYTAIPEIDLSGIKEVAGFVNSYKNIVILGLGGSSLGPKVIVDGLGKKSDKEVFFIDNVDPELLRNVLETITLSDTLFLAITKSGRTPETVSLFYLVREMILSNGLDPVNHFVIITDPVSGHLREIAQQDNYLSLEIPSAIGGRFSVMTPVGLLLTQLLDLSCRDMLEGARDMLQRGLSDDPLDNPAFKLAMFLGHEYRLGKNIHVIMNYGDSLNSFADWATQLFSESLGKVDSKGNNVGFTPHPARGVSDQHSQLQLFKEGPDDKSYTFITWDSEQDFTLPVIEAEGLEYLSELSLRTLFNTELSATHQSLSESGRPLSRIFLDRLDEYHLGALFMLYQLATSYLGSMLHVDPYDQPGVERSKTLTKELLSK